MQLRNLAPVRRLAQRFLGIDPAATARDPRPKIARLPGGTVPDEQLNDMLADPWRAGNLLPKMPPEPQPPRLPLSPRGPRL